MSVTLQYEAKPLVDVSLTWQYNRDGSVRTSTEGVPNGVRLLNGKLSGVDESEAGS